MANWQQYIPDEHDLIWAYAIIVVSWYLRPFLRAMREACSEKPENGVRGKVSIKRIIPMIFTFMLCYMIIGAMHGKGEINLYAFFALLFSVLLATSIITVTQADGFLDKISALKSGILKSTTVKQEEIKSSQVTETQAS